jgi:hypothetical protein
MPYLINDAHAKGNIKQVYARAGTEVMLIAELFNTTYVVQEVDSTNRFLTPKNNISTNKPLATQAKKGK